MKAKLSALLLLLASFNAGAVGPYWVDLSRSDNVGTGTSVTNQCGGIADTDCTPSAGDTVYLCNAKSSAQTLNTAGSAGNVITYDWRCPGGTPGSLTVSGGVALTLNSSTNYVVHQSPTITVTSAHNGIFLAGADNVQILDPQITAGAFGIQCQATVASAGITISGGKISGGTRGINCTPSGASLTYSGWTIDGVEITGESENGIRLTIESGGATTSFFTNLTITDNWVHDNGGSGIWTACGERSLVAANSAWCTGATVSRNLVESNGIGGGSRDGGINVSGHDGAVIADNTVLDVGVSGAGISMLWSKNTLISGNRVDGVNSTNGIDGEGIFIDRFSNSNIVAQNYIANTERTLGDNYGACVAIFRAASNVVRSNVCRDATKFLSFGGTETDGNLVYNNSAAGLSAHGFGQGASASGTPTTQVQARNNAINAAVCAVVTDDQTGWSNNACHGSYSGQTAGTGSVTADPQFVKGANPTNISEFKVKSTSPLCRAGTSVGRIKDYWNRTVDMLDPSIGAMDCNAEYRTDILTRE